MQTADEITALVSRLEEAAGKAAEGYWHLSEHVEPFQEHTGRYYVTDGLSNLADDVDIEDGTFIAAANPANIRSLCAAFKAMEAQLSLLTPPQRKLLLEYVEMRAERDALAKSLGKFTKYVSIPQDLSDSLWTQCKTEDIDLSADEVARIEARLGPGALKSRKSNLVLWFDGVTVGDFREAKALLSELESAKKDCSPNMEIV